MIDNFCIDKLIVNPADIELLLGSPFAVENFSTMYQRLPVFSSDLIESENFYIQWGKKMDNIIDPEKWDKLMRYMDTLPVIEDIDGGELPDPFIDMKEKKNV